MKLFPIFSQSNFFKILVSFFTNNDSHLVCESESSLLSLALNSEAPDAGFNTFGRKKLRVLQCSYVGNLLKNSVFLV